MPVEKIKAVVNSRRLAFWETLIDVQDEPARYLKYGETVVILGNVTTFGGLFGDKEYYKVEHPLYGLGYMRKEGLKELQ